MAELGIRNYRPSPHDHTGWVALWILKSLPFLCSSFLERNTGVEGMLRVPLLELRSKPP